MPVAGLAAASTGAKKPGEKMPDGVEPDDAFKRMSKAAKRRLKGVRRRGVISESAAKKHLGQGY